MGVLKGRGVIFLFFFFKSLKSYTVMTTEENPQPFLSVVVQMIQSELLCTELSLCAYQSTLEGSGSLCTGVRGVVCIFKSLKCC